MPFGTMFACDTKLGSLKPRTYLGTWFSFGAEKRQGWFQSHDFCPQYMGTNSMAEVSMLCPSHEPGSECQLYHQLTPGLSASRSSCEPDSGQTKQKHAEM